MTLYEPKWSAPGDGTNTEPGEYEAWLEFKALVEAGHLVPVEPDYEADLTLLRGWAGICNHIDHHGYCQTHALTPVDENGLCGIGRLVAAVGGETP